MHYRKNLAHSPRAAGVALPPTAPERIARSFLRRKATKPSFSFRFCQKTVRGIVWHEVIAMLEWLGNLAIVLLGLLLVTELMRIVVLKILSPGAKETTVLVVPVGGGREDVEFLLRSAAHRVKWMGGRDDKRVVCLDCGMDDETRCICRMLCGEYAFMSVARPEELAGLFQEGGLQKAP